MYCWLTRSHEWARAYNAAQTGSGRNNVRRSGKYPAALEIPKKIFGSARKIEGGGLRLTHSLLPPWLKPISPMDDLIFEEFKGTGKTWSLELDRELPNDRVVSLQSNIARFRHQETEHKFYSGLPWTKRNMVRPVPAEKIAKVSRW